MVRKQRKRPKILASVKKRLEDSSLPSIKFIRDPVHDLIRIESKLILNLLNTEPMQRLKRIKQLGVASTVYPGADHSRFVHSLGVYHLASRMLNQLKVTDIYERHVVLVAALLHDTGHGPLSHLFEEALKKAGYSCSPDHEDRTVEIILNHGGVVSILDKISKRFKKDVCDVIKNSFRPSYLAAIVSSQFDADRFDYMLRDSLMTGVQYGKFDLNWIIRNLSIGSVKAEDEDHRLSSIKTIVIDGRRGLSSLESYLLGNFYLYCHVYHHKTVQAAEGMIVKIIARAAILSNQPKKIAGVDHSLFKCITKRKLLRLSDFLSLDDSLLNTWIKKWSSTSGCDAILKDLCQRYLKRELFKAIFVPEDPKVYNRLLKEVEYFVKGKRKNPDYYVIESGPERVAYKDFFFLRDTGKSDQEINFLSRNGSVEPYSRIELPISKAIIHDLKYKENYLIVPPEMERDIRKIVEGYMR